MKQFTLFLVLFSLISAGCGTSKKAVDASSHATAVSSQHSETAATPASAPQAPAQTNYHDPTTWLLGYFNPAALRQAPHAAWFLTGLDDYMANTDALNRLFDIPAGDLSIKIVMGTWCPDSRREVPRFMKILELWRFPAERVTFVGVDESKQAPVGDYAGLKIERVPTFIFYKNNSEAGRIIEVPKTSLEQDMVNILSGNQ